MGIVQLGVQGGAHVVELAGPLGEERLLAEAGGHTLHGLVLVLLDGLVQGYQGFDSREVFGDDSGRYPDGKRQDGDCHKGGNKKRPVISYTFYIIVHGSCCLVQ